MILKEVTQVRELVFDSNLVRPYKWFLILDDLNTFYQTHILASNFGILPDFHIIAHGLRQRLN